MDTNVNGTTVENITDSVVEEGQEQKKAPAAKQPEFGLGENGEIQIIEKSEDKPEEDTETVEEETENPDEEKPDYYTPEEVRKLGLDRLDPKKIPPELLPFYKSLQADYTRKTQRLAEQQRAEQVRQVTPPQQQQQEESPRQYIDQLTSAAKQRVSQILGEEFNEYDPSHVAALTVEVQNIYTNAAQQQKASLEYAKLVNEYRDKEPDHFLEIDAFAQKRLMEELPRSKSDKILAAVQSGDTATLRDYVEECRALWYKDNLGLDVKTKKPIQQPKKAPAPPSVEGAGPGVDKTLRTKTRDMKEFRGKSFDEQVRKLVEWGVY